ncbi:GntR family transcriptional regulator of arabinose operon [Aequitasia blattaphilus]|uniref:GntR family transcriptional regulator n=1 Tax=Aequitasia blattaphilus TaxID=2949332 RepID=A0ABT1E9G2_9FIRM|nr:GntR family transcriptional regulator [Aequitasia blattaphilus]MCP1102460.1 GntR family transcriptional regulator [Aequitasia blattaphilus]MCR8615100.1 GntR family transcriptional regulator [Aequitasia blattaphilus]
MGKKPKYVEIVDWIRSQIDSGELKHGDRIASENELMSKFQVSRQTVRHALSVLVGQQTLEKKQGSGTYVSLPEMQGTNQRIRTKRIGVVTTYVNDYIFSPIIQSIEEVLSETDYTMHLSFTYNSITKEREILEGFCETMNVDGIIAEPTKSNLPNPNIPLFKELQDKGIPILQLNSYYNNLDAPHVSVNDKMTAKIVTEYLIHQGHKNIAGIFKSDDGQGGRRYLGYMEALMEAGISVKDSRISWIDTEDLRGGLDGLIQAFKRSEGCSACVCYNDEVAEKILNLCQMYNVSVPEEISVVGIDNSNSAKYTLPPLTSANNPVKDVGKYAAQGILQMIEGEKIDSVELDSEIVERESVKRMEI